MRVFWKDTICGADLILAEGCDHPLVHGQISDGILLSAGDGLADEHCRIRLHGRIRIAASQDIFGSAWLGRIEHGHPVPGEHHMTRFREGLSLAWITLSDKGSRGERIDTSGPAIRDLVAQAMPLALARGIVIPDEPELLKAALVEFCLQHRFDLVVTTGGTGVGPRDITPEVTLPLLNKRLPGFEQAMMQASLSKTPHAMISRAVVGVIGQAVVVNLPGSPKAVRENLQAILPALRHTVDKLQGDLGDCGQEP